ncbi:MAG TPA: hypothetical protein VI911_04065 [Patescibacteria group bacterium]|nr:hypothetical protein [Patescibacteria group bacterium]
MNKKLLMFGIPILLIGLVAAYTVLVSTTHVSITEGQDFQYYDWSTGVWTGLPLNTGVAYDFPVQSIAAGDEYTIQHRTTNPNARNIMYTVVANSPLSDVTLDFGCAVGTQYYVENAGTQIMTIYILNPAGATSDFGIKEIVNAGAPLTTDVQISTTYDRSEVNSSIVFGVC